jgi:FHA domain-containing protein
MRGLDLALFDGGDAAQVLAEEDLLKVTGIQPPHLRSNSTPTHATQLASPSASTLTAAGAHALVQTTIASSEALAAAFLQGAGIEPGKAHVTITPDFMHAFGEALRVAVQGSIDLLSARSEIKREFRADVTIIASGANNPLKFLPTAEGVMLQLIGQTFPGFMKEAYKDLAVHQIALMAGIRAAYAEAVASLSPAELEKNAAVTSSLLTKISSVHRKAALWDDFQQRYDSVRRHAEDDLMAFSGKTFVNAYEAAAQSAEGHL